MSVADLQKRGRSLEKMGRSWPLVSTAMKRLVARGSHGPCPRASVGHRPARRLKRCRPGVWSAAVSENLGLPSRASICRLAATSELRWGC